jgi:short-subunit dehydrogenase involved in D-alanine esterification of teichoic acids
MGNATTCGQGLAEHSVLPKRMGELIGALAENLERHQKTLDLGDENARRELEVYQQLTERFQAIAADLDAAGRTMAQQRDLPMGAHDPRALADPALMEAFERFIDVEEALLELLERSVDRDRRLLACGPA